MKGRIFLLAFFTVVASSPNLSTFISRAKLHVFSSQRSICHNVSWRKVFRQESPQCSTTNARMLDSLFKWHCSCFHPTMIRLSRTGGGAQGHTPFTVASRPNSKWLELCRAGRKSVRPFRRWNTSRRRSAHRVEQKKLLHRSAARGRASCKNMSAEVRARCRDIFKHPPGYPSVKIHEAKSRRGSPSVKIHEATACPRSRGKICLVEINKSRFRDDFA